MSDVNEPGEQKPQSLALTPEELKKRNQRNLAIAGSLAVFIVLVFLVTMLRLGGSVAERTF